MFGLGQEAAEKPGAWQSFKNMLAGSLTNMATGAMNQLGVAANQALAKSLEIAPIVPPTRPTMVSEIKKKPAYLIPLAIGGAAGIAAIVIAMKKKR